jgi:hypothetical protein
MDLGLAPRLLGFAAMSVWGRRHVRLGSAPPARSLVSNFQGDDRRALIDSGTGFMQLTPQEPVRAPHSSMLTPVGMW